MQPLGMVGSSGQGNAALGDNAIRHTNSGGNTDHSVTTGGVGNFFVGTTSCPRWEVNGGDDFSIAQGSFKQPEQEFVGRNLTNPAGSRHFDGRFQCQCD